MRCMISAKRHSVQKIMGYFFSGLIVAPTAIINGTPLDCNFCVKDHCANKFPDDLVNATDQERADHDAEFSENPGYDRWWVKKYCTMTAVDSFILYFPYILLIMALVIVLIERVFVRSGATATSHFYVQSILSF